MPGKVAAGADAKFLVHVGQVGFYRQAWTDASLGVNKSVSYTVSFKVAARAQGTVLITASITSKAEDPKPVNNRATTTVRLG